MGAVYLARRTDGEFEQEVALKIVRQSIAQNQMIERFRRERQILASLNHPNIAKLLDGGVSENGEPYLAMEYVEGKTLAEYVTELSLSLNESSSCFLRYARRLLTHTTIWSYTATSNPKTYWSRTTANLNFWISASPG